jgi:apolipoprotein D and lipocalin family protein
MNQAYILGMKYLWVLMFIISCSSRNLAPLQTVDKIDLERFMGHWYVIANIPTWVEKGAHNALETYTWNEKENRIDVTFTFNKDSFDGPKKIYTQKAFIHNHETLAEWRIQFFWPLKFPYLIIDVAPDYSDTVISVPNRQYLWIMARTPEISPARYQQLLEKLRAQDFDLSKIELVPQRIK